MMGGYGHNLSNLLKNSRRKERKAYDGWKESDSESKGIKTVPVSEEVLVEIRQKIKQQQLHTRIRNILIVVITMLLIGILVGAMVLHFQNDPGVSFGPYR
ncbi:hypothetical protein ACWGOQ_0001860 [Aquimarina sp. M1]